MRVVDRMNPIKLRNTVERSPVCGKALAAFPFPVTAFGDVTVVVLTFLSAAIDEVSADFDSLDGLSSL